MERPGDFLLDLPAEMDTADRGDAGHIISQKPPQRPVGLVIPIPVLVPLHAPPHDTPAYRMVQTGTKRATTYPPPPK
jgi:hypothetical protein